MIHVATLSDPSYVNSNTILNFAITNKVVCIVSMQISGLAPISKKKTMRLTCILFPLETELTFIMTLSFLKSYFKINNAKGIIYSSIFLGFKFRGTHHSHDEVLDNRVVRVIS
jgi:hypothetical protein